LGPSFPRSPRSQAPLGNARHEAPLRVLCREEGSHPPARQGKKPLLPPHVHTGGGTKRRVPARAPVRPGKTVTLPAEPNPPGSRAPLKSEGRLESAGIFFAEILPPTGLCNLCFC